MKLSIVIPHYQEDQGKIFPLLSSIKNQVGVNFNEVEVIIVDDGPEAIPLGDDFMELFNSIVNIRYFKLPGNIGRGLCRQYGLNRSQGDYVMFCDADDRLHSVAVLGLFLKEIETNRPDLCLSQFIQEKIVDGKHQYGTISNDSVWLHGKAFNRKFLEYRNIEFHSDIELYEDVYFVGLAYNLAERISSIPFPTYVWINNEESVTRKDNNLFDTKEFCSLIKSTDLKFERLEKEKPQVMTESVTRFMFYSFFNLQLPVWEGSEYREITEKSLSNFLKKYRVYFSNDIFLYNLERRLCLPEFVREKENIDSFLNRILTGYNN